MGCDYLSDGDEGGLLTIVVTVEDPDNPTRARQIEQLQVKVPPGARVYREQDMTGDVRER